jgi:hypothetical protein
VSIPYLQIDSDFIRIKAPMIGALLQVDRHKAVGMGADLFDFVVNETSTKKKPPDGIILGEEAALILEGVMGWTGERGRAISAFKRAGVIEEMDGGLRIKGTERYKATWEKNNRPGPGRRPDGFRTEPGRLPDGTGTGDGDGDVDKEEVLLPPSEVVVEPPPEGPRLVPLAVVPPDTPPGEWLGPDFWRWFQAKRQGAGFVAERPPHHSKLSAWWSAVRSVVKDVEALKAAVYAYGEDNFWQRKNLPFSGFMAQWEKYVPRQEVRRVRT